MSNSENELIEHVSIVEYNERAAEYDKTPGDREIVAGVNREATVLEEDAEEFVKVGEAVAIIELHDKIPKREVTDWCNSPAGKLALSHWFDHVDPEEVVMT